MNNFLERCFRVNIKNQNEFPFFFAQNAPNGYFVTKQS